MAQRQVELVHLTIIVRVDLMWILVSATEDLLG